jgi:hypothetical protein
MHSERGEIVKGERRRIQEEVWRSGIEQFATVLNVKTRK